MRRARAIALALFALALLACGKSAEPVEKTDPARENEKRRLFAEARRLESAGDLRGALREATRGLVLDLAARDGFDEVSRIYTAMGADPEAAEFFALAVKRAPYAHAYHVLGVHEFRRGRWGEALTAFDEAVRLDPGFAESWFERGIALQGQARFEEALASFRRAWEIAPTSPETAARIARLLRIQGDYDGARAFVEAALQKLPSSPALHFARGQLLLRDGRLDEAERTLRETLRLDPFHIEAKEDLAKILHRTGRDAEADREQREATWLRRYFETRSAVSRIAPHRATDPLVPLVLAEMDLTEGRFEIAIRSFRRAAELGAPRERAAAGLAEALVLSGDLAAGDEALASLEDSEDGRVDLARAAGLVASGKGKEALPHLERAVSRGPAEWEFRRRAAALFERAGRGARAEALRAEAERLPGCAEATLAVAPEGGME